MKVYHLQVQANSDRYGELIERNSFYTEIYSSMENALEDGKDWLTKKIQYIYEQSDYCTNDGKSLTIKDMFDDREIYYCFKIIEIDPEYADKFEIPDHEYQCKNLKPTHIVYYYDLEGKLLYKDLEYRRNDHNGSGYVITRYPDDEESKPNKFSIGDFVTIIDDYVPIDQPYVISDVPKRNNPKVYFENIYYLSTISHGYIFEDYYEYHESKLRKYNGKIDKDSPLILLQKLYRGEIKLSKDIIEKIKNNEILLTNKPTFKEVIKF